MSGGSGRGRATTTPEAVRRRRRTVRNLVVHVGRHSSVTWSPRSKWSARQRTGRRHRWRELVVPSTPCLTSRAFRRNLAERPARLCLPRIPDERSALVGRNEDFGEYVASRWPRLVRAAVLLGRSPAEAEDVVQTALMRCLMSWSKVERADDLDAYVHPVLLTTFTSHLSEQQMSAVLGVAPRHRQETPLPGAEDPRRRSGAGRIARNAMSEQHLSELLERAAARVPVDAPPTSHLVAGADRWCRRRLLVTTASAAVAVVLAFLGTAMLTAPGQTRDPSHRRSPGRRRWWPRPGCVSSASGGRQSPYPSRGAPTRFIAACRSGTPS